MDLQANEHLELVGLIAVADGGILELQVGDASEEFAVKIEEDQGIRLLVCGELERWLMDRELYWAIGKIYRILEAATRGECVFLPLRIEDDDRPASGP